MENIESLNQYLSSKVTRDQLEYMLQIVQASLANGPYQDPPVAEMGALTKEEADVFMKTIIDKLKQLE